jgi:hypothetical protein
MATAAGHNKMLIISNNRPSRWLHSD